MDLSSIAGLVGSIVPVAVTVAKVAEALPNAVAPVTKDTPAKQMTVAQAVSVLVLAYVAYEQGKAGEINLPELLAAGSVAAASIYALFGDLRGRLEGLFKR